MLPRAGDHVPDPARLAEAHSIQVALVTSAWRARDGPAAAETGKPSGFC
jgi:hypothetical protein